MYKENFLKVLQQFLLPRRQGPSVRWELLVSAKKKQMGITSTKS